MSNFFVGSKKRYVDTYVDPAYLASLKKAMDDEHSPKKYGKFKAWLHYANLQRWQNQGWHYAYLITTVRSFTAHVGLPWN